MTSAKRSDGTITANFASIARTITITVSIPTKWIDMFGPNHTVTGWTGEVNVFLNGNQIGTIVNKNEKALSSSITITNRTINNGDQIRITGFCKPYCYQDGTHSDFLIAGHNVEVESTKTVSSTSNQITFMIPESLM